MVASSGVQLKVALQGERAAVPLHAVLLARRPTAVRGEFASRHQMAVAGVGVAGIVILVWVWPDAPRVLINSPLRAHDNSEPEFDDDGFAEGPHWQVSMISGDFKFVWIVFLILQPEFPASRQRHRLGRFERDPFWRKVGQVGFEIPANLDGVLVLDEPAELLDGLGHSRAFGLSGRRRSAGRRRRRRRAWVERDSSSRRLRSE